MDVENKFIKCLSTTHGAKIVEFFEKKVLITIETFVAMLLVCVMG